jgi:hypothetical protein
MTGVSSRHACNRNILELTYAYCGRWTPTQLCVCPLAYSAPLVAVVSVPSLKSRAENVDFFES